MAVTLELISSPSPSTDGKLLWSATTNSEGRVTAWKNAGTGLTLGAFFDIASQSSQELLWKLTFEAGKYFKGEGWWDDIDIKFRTNNTEGRDHWHVPLLLSPWSYTTYRGS